MQSFELISVQGGKAQTNWTVWARGIPQTPAGDLKMVTDWPKLGFIIRNPYAPDAARKPADELDELSQPKYVSVERS
jgi:hypothetical protein